MSDCLDRGSRAELLPQPPDANVDHVRARVEVVSPDVREQPLPADDLALVQDEVVEEAELPVGQLGDHLPQPCLPLRDVERETAGPHDGAVLDRPSPPELGAHAGEQLVERERLRDVVAGAEVQAAQLATLAKTAAAESVRLDLREAPQRELERQQKQTDADLAAAEEAKRVNLPGFRP